MPTTSTNKKVQKYKNKTKYVPNKYNPQLNSTTPTTNCCKKCHDVIEWKKQYGKYKVITKPGKCTKCLGRNVFASYHEYCKDCSVGKCAKCFVIITEENIVPEEEQEQQEEFDLSGLTERQKRSVQRKMERGDMEGVERIMGQKKKCDLDDFDFGSEPESQEDHELGSEQESEDDE